MPSSALQPLLASLPIQHQHALAWFDERAGQIVSWPGRLEDGTLLATKAKGIYKPRWSQYALSVRQSLSGLYPDREIERKKDGSWTFAYFQEGFDPTESASTFTNVGLFECMRDVVPVGVFIQTAPKPSPRYRVLGLALVSGFDSGYFYLEGSDLPIVRDPHSTRLPWSGDLPQTRADSVAQLFDLGGIRDERERTLRLISQRRGQAGFRRTLLDAYGRRCAITGYDAEDALEAAHITPYRGPVTHHPSNGLLLRADLHTLFDLGLIAIDYDRRSLLISGDLRPTKYAGLADERVEFPSDNRLEPSREAVAWHRSNANL